VDANIYEFFSILLEALALVVEEVSGSILKATTGVLYSVPYIGAIEVLCHP